MRQCTLSKSVDDTKMEKMVDTSDSIVSLQRSYRIGQNKPHEIQQGVLNSAPKQITPCTSKNVNWLAGAP